MRYSQLKKQAHKLFHQSSWIAEIKSPEEYDLALALMDELIDEYDFNRALITILSFSIEQWENKAASLEKFNNAINQMDPALSILRLLMEQYNLGVANFPEIGSKSLVSKIINQKRRLTVDHIQALCKRFDISPSLFFQLRIK